VKQNEPFLAGFSRHLYGRAKRSVQEAMQRFRLAALRHCPGGYGLLFDDVLPAEFLCEVDKTKRNRHFGGIPVFWAWVAQILEHNASCSRGLSLIQAWCKGAGLAAPKGDTSSYCQGRKRLSEKFLDQIFSQITTTLRGEIREEDLWNGLVLKAFDGTSVKLMDTPANQKLYPQPTSQAEGCGFPVMGIVGLLNMSPIERLITWKKPPKQPKTSDLSSEEWEQLPEHITVRYIKMGYEDRAGEKRSTVVVTTLLDARKHDAMELIDLYAKRWEIELKFRDVKTTLGLEEFAVKSPEMAHKTLRMMMIAYNLLRTLTQKAAAEAQKPLAEMSFKGILDVLNTSHSLFRGLGFFHRKRARLRQELVEVCATKILDIRPARHEPRAVKRRPKPYQLLTSHRHVFREIFHKESYRKTA
jgi:hypothetical protein